MFSDEARLWVKAGDGGDGSMHFRREKYVPRGGPDGGDGGRGGSVYLVADTSLNTLWSLRRRRHHKAVAGGRGNKQRQHGAAGPDLTIKVPVGTLVRPVGSKDPLADLAEPAQRVMVAGGDGRAWVTHTSRPPPIRRRALPKRASLGRSRSYTSSLSSWPTLAWSASPMPASPHSCRSSAPRVRKSQPMPLRRWSRCWVL